MKKFVSILLAAVLCLSLGTTAFAASPDNVSKEVIEETVATFLQDKTNIIISDGKQKGPDDYEKGSEEYLIASYRDRLASKGEAYSSSRTDIEILEQTKDSSGNLCVTVNETTFLTIAENGIETGYSAKHDFIYSFQNESWILIEHRQLEPTGLLPLWQANEFVYQYNPADQGTVINDSPDVLFNDSAKEITASTDKPAIIQDEKTDSKSYSYSSMATYLETYWQNYNPNYRDFSGSGGDCTNFVSQALRAGGWTDVSGLYTNSNYWRYNSLNQTYSWTSVDYLGSFARSSGRCSMLNNVWNLRVGDFLQVKPSGSSSKVHSMMVSYYYDGVPYFTYHSNNRYRRSMNQVLEDWGSSCSYYAYRT